LFSGGFFEIGFLLFIAFLLFGPEKLPEIARTLGKGLGQLRRASDELKNSLEEEIRNLDQPAEVRAESGHELLPGPEVEAEPELPPDHGYDYSEPSREEAEPRPRG
jgi:TatA/E family protein of Tat protein translocase